MNITGALKNVSVDIIMYSCTRTPKCKDNQTVMVQTKNLAKTHQLITRSTTCKLHELIQYTTAYLEQTGGETQALSEKKVL